MPHPTEVRRIIRDEAGTFTKQQTFTGGLVIAQPFTSTANLGTVSGTGATVAEQGDGTIHKTIITLAALPVTVTAATTVSGGGGTKIYTFPEGLVNILGATTNLTVANAIDASFIGSLGSAQADTGTSLTSTEANIIPSTAATTSSGAGTLKGKSTAAAVIDGTATAVPVWLNFGLNADVTGGTAMTATGTITIVWVHLGDN